MQSIVQATTVLGRSAILREALLADAVARLRLRGGDGALEGEGAPTAFRMFAPQHCGMDAAALEDAFFDDEARNDAPEFSHPSFSIGARHDGSPFFTPLCIDGIFDHGSGELRTEREVHRVLVQRSAAGALTGFMEYTLLLVPASRDLEASNWETRPAAFSLQARLQQCHVLTAHRGRRASQAMLEVIATAMADEAEHLATQLEPTALALGERFALTPIVKCDWGSRTAEMLHVKLCDAAAVSLRRRITDAAPDSPCRHLALGEIDREGGY
jgi:hypothetical protein